MAHFTAATVAAPQEPMSHKAWLTALLLVWTGLTGLGSSLVASDAHAFAVAVPQPSSKAFTRWNTSKITFYLNPNCSPDLPQATCLDQLRLGFQGWEKAQCTALDFVEGYHCNTGLGQCLFDKGKSCSKDADCPAAVNTKVIPMGFNENGRNELVFVESGWPHGQFVLGVTSPLFYTTGTIIEADIAFNGVNYKWVANPNSIGGSYMDLLSVNIHEIGHFFGVQHMLPGSFAQNDPPTMAPSVDPFGKSATLSADDLKAACFLNPKEAAYSCASDADCPYINETNSQGEEFFAAKMVCQNSSCVWSSGGTTTPKGTLGAGCTADTNCQSGLFCQYYGNQGYCSQLCKPASANCPTGFVCLGYQGDANNGACIPGNDEPQPTKNSGEPCSASAECKSLLCIDNICRTKCTPSNPTTCTSKEDCAKLVGVSYGACVAKAEPPPLKGNGDQCLDGGECQTGVCLKAAIADNFGYCRQPCTGKGTCPAGQACIAQIDGSLACLAGSEKVPAGSACGAPGDCESGLCIAYGSEQFCSKTCDLGYSGSCPCGMSCEASTAGNVCLPGKKVACVTSGGSCASASECAGGVCEGGKCLAGCNVVDSSDCGSGQACARLAADTTQGLCLAKGGKGLGEACGTDAECSTLFCAPGLGGAKVCARPCSPANDQCGAGFGCSALGGQLGACVLVQSGSGDAGIGGADVNGTNPTVGGTANNSADGCNATRSASTTGSASALAGLLLAAAVIGRRRLVSVGHTRHR